MGSGGSGHPTLFYSSAPPPKKRIAFDNDWANRLAISRIIMGYITHNYNGIGLVTRAKSRSKPEQVTVSLAKQHYDYLTYLATKGFLGTAEHEVAAHILTEELDRRLVSGYHKNEVPKITE
jgi:hypothetical protein